MVVFLLSLFDQSFGLHIYNNKITDIVSACLWGHNDSTQVCGDALQSEGIFTFHADILCFQMSVKLFSFLMKNISNSQTECSQKLWVSTVWSLVWRTYVHVDQTGSGNWWCGKIRLAADWASAEEVVMLTHQTEEEQQLIFYSRKNGKQRSGG